MYEANWKLEYMVMDDAEDTGMFIGSTTFGTNDFTECNKIKEFPSRIEFTGRLSLILFNASLNYYKWNVQNRRSRTKIFPL